MPNCLQRTVLAMGRVGIPPADQQAIFRTVASILHMGNITFAPGPDESSLPSPGGKAEHHLAATGGVGAGLQCSSHGSAAVRGLGCTQVAAVGSGAVGMQAAVRESLDSHDGSFAMAACQCHHPLFAVVLPGECRAAELLGVEKEGLLKALTTRTRQTPEGPIVSPLDVKAATENRDSLAKIIYSKVCSLRLARVTMGLDGSRLLAVDSENLISR